MKRYFNICVLISLFTCFSFTAHAQIEVNTEFDKGVKFLKTYKAYKFKENSSFNPDEEQYSEFNKRTAYNAIHEELAWLGMKESENADLLIYVYAMRVNKTEAITDFPSHQDSYVSIFEANTTIINYDEGTLVLDFVDAKSKKLVWRGTATDVISQDEKEVNKAIKRAVQKMISKYPPIKL